MKAIWNGAILAESDKTLVVEGKHYFPPDSIHKEFFHPSDMHTTCPWKGDASYYHIVVGDQMHTDAAWYYPTPKKEAEHLKNYVAFWRGVKVIE